MNFSFELSWALLTGNINSDAMMGMGTMAAAIFGWMAMIRMLGILIIGAFMIISRWRVFSKAGLPGWGIFIPFYNRYLMFKLGGFSGRWVLSIFFPPLFIVMMIINYFKIAENFWKHRTFGLGLRFIKIVFIPILAFDDSKYLAKRSVVKIISKPAISEPIIPTKAPIRKAVKKIAPKHVKTITKKK